MTSVILCAAGSGIRARFKENKILKEYNGLPVLSYSLSAFAPFADEILVAVREEDEENIKKLLSPYPIARTVRGGKTRMESVYACLKETRGEIVLIHDAARPFVSKNTIQVCISTMKEFGSAVCSLPLSDTIALAEGGKILSQPPREKLFSLQTPQGFYTKKLKKAYDEAFTSGRTDFTDDSGVYAAFCEPPHLFSGERDNKKLTHPEDFCVTERAGFGIDTHAFGKNQDFILLGGVKIPSSSGLEAHSDGDVLCHALMDALLSAIGERDIGFHFPDSDERFRGADSMKLLEIVMKMVHGCGFCVKNISISVLAERPRLSPYIEKIQENLKAATGCESVAVAAGTNEKLGYVGEGKGITVYALALLARNR